MLLLLQYTPATLACGLEVLVLLMEAGPQPSSFVLTHIAKVGSTQPPHSLSLSLASSAADACLFVSVVCLACCCFSVVVQVQRFLLPCLALPEDAEVQKRLRRFLALLTRHYSPLSPPPLMLECNLYGGLKDAIEKRLLLLLTSGPGQGDKAGAAAGTAAQLQHLLEAAHQQGGPAAAALAAQQQQAALLSQHGPGGSNSRHVAAAAWPLVQVLEVMAVALDGASAAAALIEQFGSVLVKLLQRLARDHIHVCNALSKPGPQLPSGVVGDLSSGALAGHRVLPTPTAALLDDALGYSPPTAPHGAPLQHPSHPLHQQYVWMQQHVDPSHPDDCVLALMGCLRLLGRCISANPATKLLEQRKQLVQALAALLDKSDSVPLLLTAQALLAEWLLPNNQQQQRGGASSGPGSAGQAAGAALLNGKEKMVLLGKMAGPLERLGSEVAAQPLHSFFLRFLLQLLHAATAPPPPPPAPAPPTSADPSAPPTPAATGDQAPPPAPSSSSPAPAAAPPSGLSWVNVSVLSKYLLLGLMAAEPPLRQEVLVQRFGPAGGKTSTATSAGSGSGSNGRTSPPKSPAERLVQLLRQDWDALNSRSYWVVALVDVLLAGLRSDAPLRLEATSGQQQPAGEAMGEGALQLCPPYMRTAAWALGDDEPSETLRKARLSEGRQSAAYSYDQLMAKRLATARTKMGPSLLLPLRLMLHADPLLARDLLQPLLSGAWGCLTEQQQAQQVAPLVKLLSGGTTPYRQALTLPTYLQPGAAGLHVSVNALQTLFTALLRLKPFPALPPDVLGALAPPYKAWFSVLPAMEHMLGQGSSSGAERAGWLSVLSRLYQALDEDDLRAALRRRYCRLGESRHALSLEMYGDVLGAQERFLALISHDGLIAAPSAPPLPTIPGASAVPALTPTLSGAGGRIPQFELELWEEVSSERASCGQ